MWRVFYFTSLFSFLRYLPLSRRNSRSLNDTATAAVSTIASDSSHVTTATDSAFITTTTTTADCAASTSSTTDSTSTSTSTGASTTTTAVFTTNSAFSTATTTTADSRTGSAFATSTAGSTSSTTTDSNSTNIEQEAAAFFSLFSVSNPFKRKRQELHYEKDGDNLANRNEDSKKKRKISQADEDSKRKRKINDDDDEDSERKRRMKTTNRNVESKKKPKVNQANEDSKRKRKKNQADDEFSERKKRIKTTSRDETPKETEKPQSVFESNKSKEEEKKKKKRKRDEVEREYETRRCGRSLDHKTDRTNVAVVGVKRKKPDDVSDSMVLEEAEGFDDESKLLRTVFVRNFPLQVKKKAILEEFKQFGEIESVLIRIGDAKNPRKRANLPKNFNGASDSVDAYIIFKRKEAADGLSGYNMVVFAGNHLRVDRICPPRKKSKAGDARNLPFVM